MTGDTFDVAIVGGGLVGAAMACALDQFELRVAMIESAPIRDTVPPTYDDRSLALSLSSCRIFEKLGLWPALQNGVVPIEQVQVSNHGLFGQTRLTAAELGLPCLGHVVEARLIGQAVAERLPACRQLTVFSPATLEKLQWLKQSVKLTFATDDGPQTIKAALVIGADGTDSKVRSLCQFAVQQHDYQQRAIVANVMPERPHQNVAFERLTATGPLAVLPQVGGRCGTVRVCREDEADALLAISDTDYLADLQQRFGLRLGRLSRLGERVSYPLRLLQATEQTGERAVVIGNAAHTIHNIAAQGFNLGLRDVVVLADQIRLGLESGEAFWSQEYLAQYQQRRQADQQNVINFTDGLVRGLGHRSLVAHGLRSLGLIGLETLPLARRLLAERGMGLRADLPRWAS